MRLGRRDETKVRTVLKPPRDHRARHFIEALIDELDTGRYLRAYSSGGGTRTHNLRINSVIERVPEARRISSEVLLTSNFGGRH